MDIDEKVGGGRCKCKDKFKNGWGWKGGMGGKCNDKWPDEDELMNEWIKGWMRMDEDELMNEWIE